MYLYFRKWSCWGKSTFFGEGVNLFKQLVSQGYSVQIVYLGSDAQNLEERNFTMGLDYDWETQRVRVQLKFIQEGFYHGTVKYKGVELLNGKFNIIVLNSKFVTLFLGGNYNTSFFQV